MASHRLHTLALLLAVVLSCNVLTSSPAAAAPPRYNTFHFNTFDNLGNIDGRADDYADSDFRADRIVDSLID